VLPQSQAGRAPLVSQLEAVGHLHLLRAPDGPCDRRYVDDTGVSWCVHELVVDTRPAALYFESVAAFRCVRHYPDDWRQLTPDQLEVLSHAT
jgi:hypothetical protein